MILAVCPSCGKSYKLAEKSAGKRVACKECGEPFTIRSGREKSKAPRLPRTERDRYRDSRSQLKDLIRRFDSIGEFPKPRVTLAHRFVALLVACMMLLLPLLYVAFTAGVGWLTWWHATRNHVWMSVPSGRLKLFALLMYGGLIVAGVLWVISLIRPLFISLGSGEEEEGLSREDEPVLYEFADRLADKVGAPRPEIICLSLDVNAMASYQTRALGFGRRAFTLTLGLPLIAGLTLPQLAGVMAHEFGHFSQSGSTLLQRLIQRVNMWFAVAVHRGDAIDALIESLTDTEDGSMLLALLGYLLWILVGLGRMVLWCLMYVGLMVSATLLRRMEFDSDRYGAGVAGSQVYQEMSERIVALDVAYTLACQHISESLRADYLPADFPGFVAGLAKKSKQVRKKTLSLIRKEKSSWLSSHPSTQARIRATQKLNVPGVFKSNLPAGSLISQFSQKSKWLTESLYEHQFGDAFAPETLRSTNEAVKSYLNVMGHS